MVGGGSRKDEQLVISNNNVFAALGTLRKKKKSDKGKNAEGSVSKNVKDPEPVFWAPAPLTVKSWADVDDEDDDDYYATTAPPQAVWGPDTANEHHHKPKETVTPLQESESEEEGIDEADDDNEEEHEQEPDLPEEKEPIVKKTAENVAPKESERQLSKKELKKKELAELEAMLAEFGLSKAESNDDSQGAAQDKVEKLNGEMAKKDDNAPGESKSAKKKKKKDKSSKESKEQHDQSNGVELGNGTSETVSSEKGEDAPTVAAKDKIKKMTSLKKKKINQGGRCCCQSCGQ